MTNLKITAAAGPIGAEITGADVSRPLDTEIFQAIDGAIDGRPIGPQLMVLGGFLLAALALAPWATAAALRQAIE